MYCGTGDTDHASVQLIDVVTMAVLKKSKNWLPCESRSADRTKTVYAGLRLVKSLNVSFAPLNERQKGKGKIREQPKNSKNVVKRRQLLGRGGRRC